MIDPSTRQEARARLREAIRREGRSRRRRRFGARAVVSGIVIFTVLAFVPPSVNPELRPLLGLADAVEALPRITAHEADLWYSRSERMELVVVPDGLTGDRHLEFLLPSVHEVWVGMGDTERRRTTYGAPQFFSPEDARLFGAFDLSSEYPTNRAIERVAPVGEIGYLEPELFQSPDDVYEALSRQIAGRGERRADEVDLLRLAGRLMQTYGADPQVRSTVLRVIADIPGIAVTSTPRTIDVSFDYVDGDRPLRLSYAFDAETAYLVSESLAVLASQTEPASIVSQTRYEPIQPATGFVGS